MDIPVLAHRCTFGVLLRIGLASPLDLMHNSQTWQQDFIDHNSSNSQDRAVTLPWHLSLTWAPLSPYIHACYKVAVIILVRTLLPPMFSSQHVSLLFAQQEAHTSNRLQLILRTNAQVLFSQPL